jgi:thioredoxin-like negative regulator of GroEL
VLSGYDPLQKLHEAYLLHRAGRLDEAAQLYRALLRADPGNADVLHLFGVLQAEQGHHLAAAELIGRAIALNPHNPTAFYNRANVRHALNRNDEALSAWTDLGAGNYWLPKSMQGTNIRKIPFRFGGVTHTTTKEFVSGTCPGNSETKPPPI